MTPRGRAERLYDLEVEVVIGSWGSTMRGNRKDPEGTPGLTTDTQFHLKALLTSLYTPGARDPRKGSSTNRGAKVDFMLPFKARDRPPLVTQQSSRSL